MMEFSPFSGNIDLGESYFAHVNQSGMDSQDPGKQWVPPGWDGTTPYIVHDPDADISKLSTCLSARTDALSEVKDLDCMLLQVTPIDGAVTSKGKVYAKSYVVIRQLNPWFLLGPYWNKVKDLLQFVDTLSYDEVVRACQVLKGRSLISPDGYLNFLKKDLASGYVEGARLAGKLTKSRASVRFRQLSNEFEFVDGMGECKDSLSNAAVYVVGSASFVDEAYVNFALKIDAFYDALINPCVEAFGPRFTKSIFPAAGR